MNENPLACLGPLAVAVGLFLLVVWGIRRSNAAQEAIRDAQAEKHAQWQRDMKAWEANEAKRKDWIEQYGFRKEIVKVNESALSAFEAAPKKLVTAEEYLDRAERDFNESAFAPFWDSVEKAALTLAGFDGDVDAVDRASKQFLVFASKFREPTAFAVSKEAAAKLAIGKATADRMTNIVRRAQRNFEFSVIYEQRKTNQLLATGFRNLADALERMSDQISGSICTLAESVDSMGQRLSESMNRMHGEVKDMNAFTREQAAEAALENSARTEREKKTIEMLDNIQRRRYPS
jgi:hypothetical protein